MAFSKCPHCEGNYFEVKMIEPAGANYKQNLLQCSRCGAPFGVLDFYNLGQLLKSQEAQLTNLESEISSLQDSVRRIAIFLQQRG